MMIGTFDASGPEMAALVRRVALAVVCAALFAIFGIAAPYNIYKSCETGRHPVGTSVIREAHVDRPAER